MSNKSTSAAVKIALSHIDAWSNHNFDAAKNLLSSDVHVRVTTTQPIMPSTDTVGADEYMQGLLMFAQGVVPGSARIIDTVGDEHNAMILVSVTAAFGPEAPKMNLVGARLYQIDANGKITAEQVIFYAAPL